MTHVQRQLHVMEMRSDSVVHNSGTDNRVMLLQDGGIKQ